MGHRWIEPGLISMDECALETNRVALVTGGSRGIGRAIVLKLARRGVFTYINYLRGEDNARETLEIVRAAGGDGALCRCDVADHEGVTSLVKNILAQRRRLDILVNNAGVNHDSLLVRMQKDNLDKMIATNIKGTFNCCQAVVKPMIRQRWGRIITITSVVAEGGNAGQSAYAATKSAVLGLTTSLAKELGGRNICINAVSPGFIQTELTNRLAEGERSKILSQIPLGRSGTPEDVANLVAFLSSEEAGYITGQIIRVNGGLYM